MLTLTLSSLSSGSCPPLFSHSAFFHCEYKLLQCNIDIQFVILSVILFLIYFSSLVLHIYKAHRKRLIRRLTECVETGDLLLGGREIVATIWDSHAWFWHGYELYGLENLPPEGGCLLVYYHGALPVDYYYLVGRVLLLRETMINSVVDNFLFKVPGMKIILEAFHCTPGTVDSLAEQLSQGKILVKREIRFSYFSSFSISFPGSVSRRSL